MQKIGKEIKIGLAVIGVLVAAFGYILFRRLTRPEDLPAPAAVAAAPNAAPTARASDKPTVISATDTGRPADAAAQGANSSRSLFSSARSFPGSDSADSGAEPRGSFMPPSSSDSAANTASSSGSASGNSALPESRFSQFGHHPNASAEKSGDAPAKSHGELAANANHSVFTAGSAAAPADATAATPAAVVAAPAAVVTAPADPFQRKSAPPADPIAADSPDHHTASPLDGPASAQADPFQRKSTAGDSPVEKAATTVHPSAPAESPDGNPLRHPHDDAARIASSAPAVTPMAAAPATPPVEVPGNMFRSGGAAAAEPVTPASGLSASQSVPPPITPVAISIPSSSTTPSEPLGRTQTQAPEAPAAKPGQYIVQPNDNYWTVSEKVYGTGGYFKAIYEHNRRQHAQSDRLQVGDALDVPEVAVLQQMYPDLCPKLGGAAGSPPATSSAAAAAPTPSGTRPYTVADGDTLYEIARRQLGQPSRWGEIYQLNHDQLGNDFGYLHPGTQLLIPSDASGTAVAHEPTGTLQR